MLRLVYLAKNILKSNFSDLNTPYRLTFVVTYKCQLKCNMCNVWKKQDEKELNISEIRRFFKKSNKISWIHLSGGEIFLRKDLFEIITAIVTNCRHLYLLNFPTNGFNTEVIIDFVRRIKEFAIPKILLTVSLDGPPQLHDEIRGVSGAWMRAVNTFLGLVRLRDKRFNVYFGMTLQSTNMDKFQETFDSVREYYRGLNYNDFHVNIVHSSEHYYGNPEINPYADWNKLCLQMEKIRKLRKYQFFNPVSQLELRYQKLSDIYFKNNMHPITCQAFSASLFMNPHGIVYPCSIYDKPIGNISDFDYDINKLWDSQKRRDLRLKIKKNECPGCWTPCEAYQSILANLVARLRMRKKKK